MSSPFKSRIAASTIPCLLAAIATATTASFVSSGKPMTIQTALKLDDIPQIEEEELEPEKKEEEPPAEESPPPPPPAGSGGEEQDDEDSEQDGAETEEGSDDEEEAEEEKEEQTQQKENSQDPPQESVSGEQPAQQLTEDEIITRLKQEIQKFTTEGKN